MMYVYENAAIVLNNYKARAPTYFRTKEAMLAAVGAILAVVLRNVDPLDQFYVKFIKTVGCAYVEDDLDASITKEWAAEVVDWALGHIYTQAVGLKNDEG